MSQTQLMDRANDLIAAVRSGKIKPLFSQQIPANKNKQATTAKADLSTIGTQIREIIEAELGRKLTCTDCLGFLRGLNQQANHDHDAIVKHLSGHFPWPAEWRAKSTHRRDAISQLIAPVVPAPAKPAEPTPAVLQHTGTLQFIIPYYLAESRSDELRWCLRSIHKHYQGQAHVTLIGDKPDWYVGHHINKPRLRSQPFRRYRDSLSKIDMIRYCNEIGPDVMWVMDDCYFLRSFTASDFAQGRINDRKPGSGGDEWNIMLRLTQAAQIKTGLPVLDFSCHLPQMINRDRWHEMFERFELAKQPMVWESLYGSMFAIDPQPHQGFMLRLQKSSRMVTYKPKLEKCWMLNHTHEAWNQSMRDWLAEQFPEPSPDEKS